MTEAIGREDAAPTVLSRRDAFVTLGAALVLIPTLIRLAVSIDPMPTWATDLLVMWIPPSGLGPLGSIVLDLVTVFGCAIVLMASPLHVRTVGVALGVIGAAGVLGHLKPNDANAVVGLPWVAAACAGLAAAHLPRRSAARAAMVAALLGIVVLLGSKAVVQVFIEHPATVANYKQTRESFLASRGWSPDSTMARNYERRLMQPEATGWFGLANVFGSLAAAWTVALAVTCVTSLRSKLADRRVPLVLGVASVIAAVAVALSHSKGAIGAVLVAIPALLIALRLPRRAGLLVGLVPVVVLAGVIVRGLIGERIGELSILFRWFYIQGATGVFLDHPLLGVGPAGFKDAYMLAKPAVSPEEVSSPHSIFFDWLANLGLFGGAWIVLLAAACRAIGQNIARPGASLAVSESRSGEAPLPGGSRLIPADDPLSERVGTLVAIGSIAVAIAASAYFERNLPSPEMGLARAIGLVGGLGIAWAVMRTHAHCSRAIELALAGAALVVLAHTQIETTLVNAGAAPAAALLIGLACAPPTRPRCPRANPLTGAVVTIVALAAGGPVVPTMWRWSNAMSNATEAVRPIGEAISELEAADPGSAEQAEAVRAISNLAGVALPRSGAELEQAVVLARHTAALEALSGLEAAVRSRPHDGATREAGVRVHVSLAGGLGDPSQRAEHASRALEIAREGAALKPESAASWGLLANVHLSLSGTIAGASFDGAIAACERAAEFDPHGLSYPLKLVGLLQRAGRLDDARIWALRALETDRNLHLDPLRQLTEEERVNLENLVRE